MVTVPLLWQLFGIGDVDDQEQQQHSLEALYSTDMELYVTKLRNSLRETMC